MSPPNAMQCCADHFQCPEIFCSFAGHAVLCNFFQSFANIVQPTPSLHWLFTACYLAELTCMIEPSSCFLSIFVPVKVLAAFYNTSQFERRWLLADVF